MTHFEEVERAVVHAVGTVYLRLCSCRFWNQIARSILRRFYNRKNL